MDEKTVQSLVLENRKQLSVTGVESVGSFNEETVILNTNKGKLTVKGQSLTINKLNVDEGKLTVNGDINSLTYSERDAGGDKTSFVKKLFK